MSPPNKYTMVIGGTKNSLGRLIECSQELYEFLRDNIKSTAIEDKEVYIVEIQ